MRTNIASILAKRTSKTLNNEVIKVPRFEPAITVIEAYSGIQTRAENTKTMSDASNDGKQLALMFARNGSFPAGSSNPGLPLSDSTVVQYSSDGLPIS